MIRKLPFMLIALCFLLSCGGDDPLDIKPEAPENPEKPEIQTKRIKTMTVFTTDYYSIFYR